MDKSLLRQCRLLQRLGQPPLHLRLPLPRLLAPLPRRRNHAGYGAPGCRSSSGCRGGDSPAEARITITLNQIPLGEALRYIASQAGLKVKVEPYAVSIIPISEQSNDLITKEYRVPPDFISTTLTPGCSVLRGCLQDSAGKRLRLAQERTLRNRLAEQQLVNREGAKEFLEAQGVAFPPGASANFLPQSSRLIVRNTQDNLDLVDAIVEQLNVAIPKQVEIESKFVEITQNNLKELGFDWLLGPFKVGNQGAFGSGGTSGTGAPVDPANFPFVNPVTGSSDRTEPGYRRKSQRKHRD